MGVDRRRARVLLFLCHFYLFFFWLCPVSSYGPAAGRRVVSDVACAEFLAVTERD